MNRIRLGSQFGVIPVTETYPQQHYAENGVKGSIMAASGWQLNRFERLLFWAAVILGGMLIIARVGTMFLVTILHHVR
jgi:hypothetical protein